MKKINAVLFISISLTLCFFQFCFDSDYLNQYLKPWHMQPFSGEDSLSSYVKEHYKVLEKNRLYPKFTDSSKTVVNVLVDAWGVSMEDSIVRQDFAFFEELSHDFFVHRRQLNFNIHVEKVELRNDYENSIFLFGGDSLEYDRNTYIPQIGFSNTIFCQNCSDSIMTAKLDSILSGRDSLLSPLFIGFTTQSSRDGNRNHLLSSLKNLENLAAIHPDVAFVIQGTHRPILGTPETRKKYYAHWVPVVVINAKEIGK